MTTKWKPYQNVKVIPLTKKSKQRRSYPERDLVHLPLMRIARHNSYCRDYLIHIANERNTSLQQGAILKAMGVMAGCSDLFLAVPNKRYGGYWIELKAPGKRLSQIQEEFLSKMDSIGYATGWFDDWQKAWDSIQNYLVEI